MRQFDMVIIGGGISGLSLAHYCVRAGWKTLVLEKAAQAGGCFATHSFGPAAPGFWIELGAHTCYNSYGNLISILEDCGLTSRIIGREKVGFRMYADGRICSIPSRISFPELLCSAHRLFTLKKEGQSVESYYGRIVGQGNYAKVFGPAFNAVISQKAGQFPAEFLFRKRPRRKDIRKSYTFDSGLRTVIQGISVEPGRTVRTAVAAEDVRFDKGVFTVTGTGGEEWESRNLGLAVPPNVAALLLSTSFPEIAAVLNRVRVEVIETVGVALKKEALPLKPLAGIIAADDSFYSAVSRDTVPHPEYRGFAFHFKPGLLEHKAKINVVSEVLRVGRRELLEVVARENRIPSLVVGHGKTVADIDALIAGRRLAITGNYFLGLAVEDCVSRSLAEFTRLKALARE